MRAFKIIIHMLAVYIFIIIFGLTSNEAFNALIINPINQYRNMVFFYVQSSMAVNQDNFYTPARNNDKGLSHIDQDQSYGGYTYFITADKHSAVLVDERGEEIHSWGRLPENIWTDPDHLAQKVNSDFFESIRSFLDPKTGDSYTIYGTQTATPGYFGLVKFNIHSEIEWIYDGFVHHDLEFTPNGDIYILGQTVLKNADPELPNIAPPYIDEEIILLNKDGEEVKKISMLHLFKASPLQIILDRISHIPQDHKLPDGDIFHTNTIELVPESAIGKAPMLKRGHLMISFRNLDLLIMVDPDAEKITWASYGPWKGQHSPQIQPDGSVIMFDNQGSLKKEGQASRVLQIDLNTLAILWEYNGTDESPLFSPFNSSVDILPNSNILVTESSAGRIFEVTRDKEIVWEYWNPERKIIDGVSHIPAIYSGMRFTKEELPFLRK